MRYIDEIKTMKDDDPQNALILGTALHTGIEKDIQTAVKEYFELYPVIDDAHLNEIMKLEYIIPRMKDILPDGKHEVKIITSDYIG